MIVPKDRVFERSRGCWNCKHFENAELARKHWAARRPQDELYIMTQLGSLDLLSGAPPDRSDPRFQALNDMEDAVQKGQAGLCLKGQPGTDFVHYKFLCTEWSGREGASVATAGQPVDPLPAELYEIAESRAKKKED